MIKGNGIVKEFDGFYALSGLNINVPKGSVYGLIGPNGAGKTTLIKSLMSIYKINEGKIEIANSADIASEELKQRIIYISDDLYFYPGFSIKQMAKFYADIYKNWDNAAFEAIGKVIDIDPSRKVRKLSKGMQKQVAFWLGISAKPDLMILDEPVDGLDPVARRTVMNIVLQEVESRNMTVLISSHNLRELEDICDHVGIMHDGKVVIEKSLDDVKGNIHKIQVAFKGDFPEKLETEIDILKKEAFGSVELLVVRGDGEQIRDEIEKYNPVICDILPLSLEEVFIYELGGMGYELKKLVI